MMSMVVRSGAARSGTLVSAMHDCTVVQFPSPGAFAEDAPGKLSDLLAGRRCDPRRFRAMYPDRWSSFVRAHFQSPLHAAVFFDVDEKTARHWWEGTNTPQGWVVDFAVQFIPGARTWLQAA